MLRSNSPDAVHSTSVQASLSPTKFIRITQHPAPDLSYTIQIRGPPTRKHKTHKPPTEHTLAIETTLFNFSTSTFSFSDFGPFAHFLSQHSPADVACITSVQWEAHDSSGIAGGSTLTVAKMLVEKLPGLKSVEIRLIMSRSESENWIVQRNVKEWKEGLQGLKGLKQGLYVSVQQQEKKRFEKCVLGDSVRWVDPSGGAVRKKRVNGLVVAAEEEGKAGRVLEKQEQKASGGVDV
jgi:hypothetical protein